MDNIFSNANLYKTGTIPNDPNWHTPKLFDGFNYESKNDDIERKRSWGMLLGSQHFKGRGVCWSFRMGTRRIDNQVNYSHRLAQTKQQLV
jgi:hypothetical protein